MMYLISIKPKFAYEILRGFKRFELRKYFGLKVESGDKMIIYASGHVRAIVGEFTAGRVIVDTPPRLKSRLLKLKTSSLGLNRDDWSYVVGAKLAMAIEVLDPIEYVKSVTLRQLRSILPDFNPPMSFRRIYSEEPLYVLIIKKLQDYSSVKGY